MKTLRFLIPFFWLAVAAAQPGLPPARTLPLRDGWALQSSAKVTATGEAISGAAFKTKDWIQAKVPTTVVAAQVKSGLLPDPFYAMNLRQYPGVSYPVGFNFSNIPMPPDSPYAVSWWYRKEFTLPTRFAGKTVWLNFRGINYRANIFLNGKQIANSNEIAGAWRTYELDRVLPAALRFAEALLFLPVLRFFSTRSFQQVCNAPVSVSSSASASRMCVAPILPQPP